MKYFTVASAEALIPELEKIFFAVIDLAARAEEKLSKISDQEHALDPADLAIAEGQLQYLAGEVNTQLQKIAD